MIPRGVSWTGNLEEGRDRQTTEWPRGRRVINDRRTLMYSKAKLKNDREIVFVFISVRL